MNIFLHELKAYRRSTITWILSLAGLMIVFLSIYPVFSNNVADMQKMLDSFPEPVKLALGISLINIGTILGFFSFTFIYSMLVAAIQAMNMGTSILSKEVREQTADFLMTKPVSRARIMTMKLLAVLTSLIVTNIIYIAVSLAMIGTVNTAAYDMKAFMLIALTLFFVQLIFTAIGVLISVIAKKIKSVISISLSVVFGFFIIGMLGDVIGQDKVRYITPFKYFDPSYIIKNGMYETQFAVLGAVIVIAAIAAGYRIYMRKDIHAL
jgi:ABC-2 type transport system permease protein